MKGKTLASPPDAEDVEETGKHLGIGNVHSLSSNANSNNIGNNINLQKQRQQQPTTTTTTNKKDKRKHTKKNNKNNNIENPSMDNEYNKANTSNKQ